MTSLGSTCCPAVFHGGLARRQCTRDVSLSETERGNYCLIVLPEKQSSCSSSCFLSSFSLAVQCNCVLKVVNGGFPIDFVQSKSVGKCINVMNLWMAVKV